MKPVIAFIRKKPIASFFIITFAITWGLGFSYGAVLNRDRIFLVPLMAIATCGPSLAGIIVTRLCESKEKIGKKRGRPIAFILALILSTAVFTANTTIVNGNELSVEMIALIALLFVPPVAFIISAAYSRRIAVKRYVASLIKVRGVLVWSLLAAMFVPILVLISTIVSSWLGKHPHDPSTDTSVYITMIGAIVVRFLYQLFFFNVVGEEIGWSGFARSRLQRRFNPLVTGLIVALFWAPWHLFLWIAEGKPVANVQFWFDAYLYVIPLSIIIGWLYNRSKGSILVAGIAHAASNTALAFIPNVNIRIASIVAMVAAAAVVVTD
ncbi:MAG: CPBP family intramembrane metalloprotease, partial [Spirochaetales bacterium]|nr:CPBP family intramembrane metalloprotease [Spirochaetales bacterium]